MDITTVTAADLPDVRELFVEYAASLGFSLEYQHFEQELAELPGAYAAPSGALRLARVGEAYAGCIAMRPLDAGTCEMKRLYVRPAYRRGHGIGRALASTIVADARERGYRRMRLDTLGTMTAAIALYRSLGFVDIAPYYASPLAGTTYMELIL